MSSVPLKMRTLKSLPVLFCLSQIRTKVVPGSSGHFTTEDGDSGVSVKKIGDRPAPESTQVNYL